MPQEKLLTLEETAQRLSIPEDTILDLVAENKLSAVMQNGKMSFRESDVESLGVDTPTIVSPPEADSFELEPEEGTATQQINFEEDEDIGLGTEEIVFEDDDLNITVEDDAPGATESVTADEDTVTMAEESDTYGLDDESAHERPDLRGSGLAGDINSIGSVDYNAYQGSQGGMGWAVALILTAIVGIVLPLTILMSDVYLGAALRDGAFTISELNVDGSIPSLGKAAVPPHISSVIESAEPQKLFGMVDLDRTIMPEAFKEKWKVKDVPAPVAEETTPEGEGEAAPAEGEVGPEGAAPAGDNPFGAAPSEVTAE